MPFFLAADSQLKTLSQCLISFLYTPGFNLIAIEKAGIKERLMAGTYILKSNRAKLLLLLCRAPLFNSSTKPYKPVKGAILDKSL